MAKKKFVLRIDEEVMTDLERWAADEFRSINGQLEWLISKALKDHGRLKKDNTKIIEKEEEDTDQTN